MSRLPIIDTLKQYKDKNFNYYAMPGHKMGQEFEATIEGKMLVENFIKFDITEVDGMDNLHNPTGIIKESQQLLSRYYKSEKSYYLVNGSTSGNMIMIFTAFEENDKIIVERNCHRSVFNSIMLRKLKPIYIKNKINEKYDAPFSIDKEHLLSIIKDNPDARGILLTYPNYYGICADLQDVINEAKKHNMVVLVDGAHGAHFGISEKLPHTALDLGCDMVVNSAHKTLPSLTQTAFLHVNNKELINKADFYMSIFSTTSPSYVFLASMEYSRYYMETYGKDAYEELIQLCEEYRRRIENIGFYHIICEEDVDKDSELLILLDKTRYVINVPKGYSGHELLNYLLNNNIQAEMSDNRNVVLIFSPTTTRADMERLYEVLKSCDINILITQYIKPIDYSIPMTIKLPWEVLHMEKETCSVEDSLNRICGQPIVPYPPGIPLVMAGEVITKGVIENINYYKDRQVDLLGLDGQRVIVLNEKE